MDFFTKEDLLLLSKWASIDYDSENNEHTEAGKKLREGPFKKTKYWCESVAKEVNMEANSKRNWLKQGGKRGWRFRPYAWGRIYDQNAPLTEVYFTVGINTTEDEDPFLQFKIDYQHETPKQLNEHQQELAHNLTRTDAGYRCREKISLENLENYNWERLIKETANFIHEYKDTYLDIVDSVFSEREKYFTRICWNTNGWKNPSGPEGKSTSKESFEGINGFGMEEWLFADQLYHEGYQYGFLQAINQSKPSVSNFNVDLYSVEKTPSGSKVYWVSTIKNVEVIDEKEALTVQKETGFDSKVVQYFKRNEIAEKVDKSISSLVEETFLNVKFKLEYVEFPDTEDLKEVDLDLSTYPRYKLYNGSLFDQVSINPNTDKEQRSGIITLGDGSRDRSNNSTSVGRRTPGSYQIVNRHDEISRGLETYLKDQAEERESVIKERELGNKYIDMVYELDDEIRYYEIKTHPKLVFCVREGIGQLMEYAFWRRGDREKKLKLILVSPHKPNKPLKDYIDKLQSKFGLPIHYQQFDLEAENLGELI